MEYAILLVCGIKQDIDKAKIKKLLSLQLKLMYPPAVAKVLLGDYNTCKSALHRFFALERLPRGKNTNFILYVAHSLKPLDKATLH